MTTNVNQMGPITKRSIELMQTTATGRGGDTLSIQQRSALTAAAILMRTLGYPAAAKLLESVLVRG